MSVSKLLKEKENTTVGARAPRLCRILVLVFAACLLGGQGAYARELSLGGPPDDVIEEAVDEAVEEQAEEQVEEQTEEAVRQSVEDRLEERTLTLGDAGFEQMIEEQFEDSVEDTIEDTVEDAVNDNIEVTLEANIEEEIEESVEDTIEAIVDESVEESVEVAVEEKIEESVAENVTEAVEESVEETVEEQLAASVEQNVESGVEAAVEETVAQNVEASVEANVEANVEAGLESDVEGQVAAAVEERLEDDIDQILERIEIDEDRIHKDQWLVMAAPEVFEELAEEGYLFDTVTELPGMGLRLAEVAAPSSFDISRVRQGVIDVVGKERAQVDLNHIYTAGDQVEADADQGLLPRTAVIFPEDIDQMPLRIGMIDSMVDVSHPSLNRANIHTRSFTPKGAVLPSFHGTAIASIIAGDEGSYRGIAPRAEMYAASVFEQDEKRGEIASTVSLVMALDWLISSGVDVVNISLAGPPNRLLEAALKRAAEHNVMILAAAGNGGPVAEPMYPAAYDTVVAVTAVDAAGQVFRLANRGDYLDLSAPGVGMLHARSGGGYAASSGTSFAVPFAATAVARLRQLQPADDVLQVLYRSAQDLGPPGRDSIYGYGLLRPAQS